MKRKKKSNKKAYVIYGISFAVVICVLISIAILDNSINNNNKAPGDNQPDDTTAFDATQIPTYTGLDTIMDKAVKELYGDSYSDIMSEATSTTLTIPRTQISFNRIEVGDAVDTMAVTAMAFLRNPYAKSPDHPVPLQLLIENTEGSVRTMPDGGSINLAEVIQDYTDLKLIANRDNPALVTVEGYCNGDYFTEAVNLMGLYEQYYIN